MSCESVIRRGKYKYLPQLHREKSKNLHHLPLLQLVQDCLGRVCGWQDWQLVDILPVWASLNSTGYHHYCHDVGRLFLRSNDYSDVMMVIPAGKES